MTWESIEEAAKRLDRTPDAVRKMAQRGALEAKKIGKVWIIKTEAKPKYQKPGPKRKS